MQSVKRWKGRLVAEPSLWSRQGATKGVRSVLPTHRPNPYALHQSRYSAGEQIPEGLLFVPVLSVQVLAVPAVSLPVDASKQSNCSLCRT
jgi:hypothetical protein